MELTLDSPIRFLPRVGPAMATRLRRLGIETIEDFLYHIPFRYDDFRLVSKIAHVQPGESVTVNATVETMKSFFTKTGKKIQEARISDDTGKLSVIWFNQPYLISIIRPGDTIHFSGPVSWFGNKIVMSNPQYEIISDEDGGASLHTGRLVPVYRETEGVSSKWMRGRIAFLLETMLTHVTDILPASVIREHHLMDLAQALKTVHFPENPVGVSEARRRLSFDELFFLQLQSYEQKRIRQTSERATPFTIPKEDIASCIAALPFRLTEDQLRAIDEILKDLEKPIPMNRLLEGDVGSGKTVVAAMAMYAAYRNGATSILMAPTQILAEQHYKTLSALFNPMGIEIALVIGGKNKEQRTKNKEQALTVGTHALLTQSRTYDRLGLVIVDEQQRFGVEQRAKLTDQKNIPHLLTMTATPIPRTLAKTVFGNLDLSVLSQMPSGRQKVKTWVVPNIKRQKAYAWIKDELTKSNAQGFVVCPLIEESETFSEVKAVTKEYERLKKIFPTFSLGLLHGRLKPQEKTQVLADFQAKKHTILVTTPVVEVGIDIPNATIMLIEAAERFGLGQLHQLRGRVGRGALQSYCLVFTESDDEKTLRRLKALETLYDGPRLAEVDLSLRGPGELFGTRQHGSPHLRVANMSDMGTIEATYQSVRSLTADDPELTTFPLLREKLKKSKIQSQGQD